MTTVAVAAVARSTFDVEFAAETADRAFGVISGLGFDVIGDPSLLLDVESVDRAAKEWLDKGIDALIVLQATFTDTSAAVRLAASTGAPLVLWAFPEERTGGRLRLNSLCGINLAGYVLKRAGSDYRWLFHAPAAEAGEALIRAVGAPLSAAAGSTAVAPDAAAHTAAERARRVLASARIGVIGDHPDGFEPCAYDPSLLVDQVGASAVSVPLPRLFAHAREASPNDVIAVRNGLRATLDGVDDMDPESLDQSVRLHLGLRRLVDDHSLAAVATRCWPECFTEFGAAACTPQSLLTELGTPATCEADVYGSATALALRELSGGAPFISDLVDLDVETNTGVLWHCGLAPLSLADEHAPHRATIHSNRRKPLLNEFPLKPGRVTIARLSQSANVPRLVIGGGEMLRAPLAFSGTAGVVRFDRRVPDVFATIMSEGLEHHYGVVYGDVRAELHALAEILGFDTVEL